MKRWFLAVFCMCFIYSCKTKSSDTSTLPKDISLMPERTYGDSEEELAKEAERLRVIFKAIDSLANSKKCRNAKDWRISPLGSKTCGGPASYLAYHKSVEEEIIPKIQEYTRRQSAYNRKRNIFEDCTVETQPSDIICENGKAVLVKNDEILIDEKK